MDNFLNPIETVQLVPIFTYLNLLSDFLLIENYLHENDQTKQIPIVNGLYKYLHDNKKNKTNKIKLIRHLLKGSDLYGAKENEQFDVTFINVMFEYIISSLVFDKYGGIYGFLAKVFLNTENFEINEVLNATITYLENETFENEYGGTSMLSILAVDRIFNDLIAPLFPQTESNLSLLSLDYVYAQAGSLFLQTGQMNRFNFTDFEPSNEKTIDMNLFDEYLITGQVIEKLILTDEGNYEMLKAFALPALVHHTSCSKFLFTNENMARVISRPSFWHDAYKDLFQYTVDTFNDIDVKLKNDYTFQMHMTLLNFQTCISIAETILGEHCPNLDISHESQLTFYINHPKSLNCMNGDNSFDPKKHFRRQVNDISELFERSMFQTVTYFLSNYLSKEFKYETVIKLLVPNNKGRNFTDSKYLFYNLLEVFTPKMISFDYYIIDFDNYNITITNELDTTNNYTEDIRLYFQNLKRLSIPIVLKTEEENSTVFLENFVKYKKSRFVDHLQILNNCNGENREMKLDWWKEFGFALMPLARCLVTTTDSNYRKICATESIRLLYRYSNKISSNMINNKTQSYLSFVGSGVKSILLKIESNKTVDEIVPNGKYRLSVMYEKNEEIFQDIALNINKPEFQLYATNQVISQLENIINSLIKKTRFSFSYVISSLTGISILKSKYYRCIGTMNDNRRHLIFVNTLNNKSDTGYGYKFIFVSSDLSKIAISRTVYEFSDERFFVLDFDSETGEKKYLAIDNKTLEPEPNNDMCEIDNRLRSRFVKVVFSGISTQIDDFDENCSDEEYFEKRKNYNRCRRRQRLSQKIANEQEAIEYIKRKEILTDKEIRECLEKYTFPDKLTLMSFVSYWVENYFSKVPTWSEDYIIENSNLFNQLMYNSHFESHAILDFNGEFRINSFYTKNERSKIEEDARIEDIIKSYNEQKARFSLPFHDYYAIRNYATTGYMRIASDTNEAKFMKLALYKLAIRQSEDPVETFELKLFRIESKPISIVNLMSSEGNITLHKFTQTYPILNSATRFSGYPLNGYTNILYEMVFSGPYPRVKFQQFYDKKEENVILLPGTKFSIEEFAIVMIEGLGKVLRFKLKFQNASSNKFVWLQKIMNEIEGINF